MLATWCDVGVDSISSIGRFVGVVTFSACKPRALVSALMVVLSSVKSCCGVGVVVSTLFALYRESVDERSLLRSLP